MYRYRQAKGLIQGAKPLSERKNFFFLSLDIFLYKGVSPYIL